MARPAATPSFHDQPSLHQALIQWGLSPASAAKLAALARPALYLTAAPQPKRSKLGGLPDLPPGMAWPLRPPLALPPPAAPKGLLARLMQRLWGRPDPAQQHHMATAQPYGFIAQLALAELDTPAALHLPKTGMLYLFYDDLAQPWGFDPLDATGLKLIYLPDSPDLHPAQRPDLMPANLSLPRPDYGTLFLAPRLRLDPVPPEGLHFDALHLPEPDIDAYAMFLEAAASAHPGHKLGGWPDLIQNAMEEECALVTQGIYCGGPDGYKSAQAKAILAQPNDWVLLLQIDSEDNIGMMWGDSGRLFVWIKQNDLAAGDFDKAWLILQCY